MPLEHCLAEQLWDEVPTKTSDASSSREVRAYIRVCGPVAQNSFPSIRFKVSALVHLYQKVKNIGVLVSLGLQRLMLSM